jgi:hypothetical protein
MLRCAATGRFRSLVLTAATGPRDYNAAGQGHRYRECKGQNDVKTLIHRIRSYGDVFSGFASANRRMMTNSWGCQIFGRSKWACETEIGFMD